jgi:hypothetical protein
MFPNAFGKHCSCSLDYSNDKKNSPLSSQTPLSSHIDPLYAQQWLQGAGCKPVIVALVISERQCKLAMWRGLGLRRSLECESTSHVPWVSSSSEFASDVPTVNGRFGGD